MSLRVSLSQIVITWFCNSLPGRLICMILAPAFLASPTVHWYLNRTSNTPCLRRIQTWNLSSTRTLLLATNVPFSKKNRLTPHAIHGKVLAFSWICQKPWTILQHDCQNLFTHLPSSHRHYVLQCFHILERTAAKCFLGEISGGLAWV